jgi:hypothetical protein
MSERFLVLVISEKKLLNKDNGDTWQKKEGFQDDGHRGQVSRG